MSGEQVFIGLATAGLCITGMLRETWFLRETKKGRWLLRTCGEQNAAWVLRGLLALGVLFGLALASGTVNPIRWTGADKPPDPIADTQRLPVLDVLQSQLGRRLGSVGTIS